MAKPIERRCEACDKPLVLCPMCFGSDPWGGQRRHGYYICADPACRAYEVCCGC